MVDLFPQVDLTPNAAVVHHIRFADMRIGHNALRLRMFLDIGSIQHGLRSHANGADHPEHEYGDR